MTPTGFLNRWRMGEEDNYANFTSSAYDMLLRVAGSVCQPRRPGMPIWRMRSAC